MEEISSCPLCESPKEVFFKDIHDAGQQLKFLICRRCGLGYQSPRMDEEELEQFYTREYRIQRQESENPIEKDLLMRAAAEVDHFSVTSPSALELLRFRLPIKSGNARSIASWAMSSSMPS